MKRQFLCQFSKTGKFNLRICLSMQFFIWHIFAAGLQIEFFPASNVEKLLEKLTSRKLKVFLVYINLLCPRVINFFARKHLFLKQWKLKFDCNTNEISNGNIYLQIDCIEGFSFSGWHETKLRSDWIFIQNINSICSLVPEVSQSICNLITCRSEKRLKFGFSTFFNFSLQTCHTKSLFKFWLSRVRPINFK